MNETTNMIETVKLQEHGGFLVNGSMSVPEAEGNRHYAAIQEWIAEGNTPEAADVPPAPTYQELRATAYPSVAEQMDMQYWDGVNGTTTWTDAIAAVKAQYPKEAPNG